MSDSEIVKAKYAEIAALRKAIADRGMQEYPRGATKVTRGVYPTRGYKSRFPKTPYSRVSKYEAQTTPPPMREEELTGVPSGKLPTDATPIEESPDSTTIPTQSTTDTSTTTDLAYVTQQSKGSLKLLNSEAYKKDQARFLQLQRIRELENRKELILRNQYARKQRISKNRIKADGFDRVEIEGDKFAVTKEGSRLVPITLPLGAKSTTVTWNNHLYERKKNGVLKYNSRRRKMFVFLLTLKARGY